ncbi:MAG: gluconate 2-dehydrogenase subunit 3 family protein [Alphaproteobacteria bacterium]|nr:gluconate 2-dehydrogenase subunit 3 family protein [Alphaproteobacteria bacterium]
MTPHEIGLLNAAIDRIVPRDKDPGAIDLGTHAYVRARLAREAAADAAPIAAGLAELDAAALNAFADLDGPARDALLAARQDAPWFRRLCELVREGFYADEGNGGNAGNASWKMVGYEPRLPAKPVPRISYAKHRDERPDDIVYDAVVIGAGAGGGVAACVLAEAGKRVLLLERGDAYDYDQSGRRDHLRNHRNQVYGHNTGPDLDGNPRVFVDPAGGAHIVAPHDKRYHSNAAGPGSGTAVYGAQAWRFLPDDFRMVSRYGVPAGSSLADWPLSYADLAPDYERAEWEIGVAGSDTGHPAPRERGYPMPPLPGYRIQSILKTGAAKLGYSTFSPPLLINSKPYQGRAACIECGSCAGFACPSDGKNGTQNTAIPRALATGRCTFIVRATVERIETAANGEANAVVFRHGFSADAPRIRVRTRSVVLSAGAIETARMLLLSAGGKHAHGIGNNHDQVGRNLQGHIYPTAIGLFDEPVYDSRGPGVTIATCDFNHGNPGIIGGGMLADDFIVVPAIFAQTMFPPEAPFWGQGAKNYMRENYRRITQVRGPIQEIPNPHARVTLDGDVKDRFGLAVAQLSGTAHPESFRTAEYMLGKAVAWIEAAGAKKIWTSPQPMRLTGGQHQAGTARMGDDPRNSVTDSYGRVWSCPNLVVADASLHVTNGGFNPVLTILALAYRNATRLAKSL